MILWRTNGNYANESLRIWSAVKVSWVRICSHNDFSFLFVLPCHADQDFLLDEQDKESLVAYIKLEHRRQRLTEKCRSWF